MGFVSNLKYIYDILDRISEIQYNIGSGGAFETVYSYTYNVTWVEGKAQWTAL